ncbi:MAG: hypothetical protein QOC65_1511 [Sphingomonadales bacterium]|nr:hypothetical protein [Sphingomonadales bacterium]
MNGGQLMVVLIVTVVMIAGIVRAKMGVHRHSRGSEHGARDDAEAQRLRDEVKQLKERLQVLERITVEKENSLEREIERLRDR